MNAADVLVRAWKAWNGPGGNYRPQTKDQVDHLLAHGEQGVAILPDGTLCRLVHSTADRDTWTHLYTLAPVSAEAGDTDG